MGTLSSELAPHAERLTARPRIYADANVPAGLVEHMRQRLHWDVLFVLEDENLRRASDVAHFRLAHQLRRTLVTMDRDYLDDRRFPPGQGGGVLVFSAPDERRTMQELGHPRRHRVRATRRLSATGQSQGEPAVDRDGAAGHAGTPPHPQRPEHS